MGAVQRGDKDPSIEDNCENDVMRCKDCEFIRLGRTLEERDDEVHRLRARLAGLEG